jgi:hypothetical protein
MGSWRETNLILLNSPLSRTYFLVQLSLQLANLVLHPLNAIEDQAWIIIDSFSESCVINDVQDRSATRDSRSTITSISTAATLVSVSVTLKTLNSQVVSLLFFRAVNVRFVDFAMERGGFRARESNCAVSTREVTCKNRLVRMEVGIVIVIEGRRGKIRSGAGVVDHVDLLCRLNAISEFVNERQEGKTMGGLRMRLDLIFSDGVHCILKGSSSGKGRVQGIDIVFNRRVSDEVLLNLFTYNYVSFGDK